MSPKRELGILMAGRALQIGILALSYRALTHMLPQTEVGLYFFLLSMTGAFGLMIVNPIGTFFNRHLHGWQKAHTLQVHCLKFAGFAAVIAIAAVGLVYPFLPGENSILVAGAVALFVLGATVNNTFIPALNLLGQKVRFVVLTVTAQAATLFFAAMAAMQSPNAAAWLAASGAAQILFGAFGFFEIRKHHRAEWTGGADRESAASVASVRTFAAPLVLANLGVWGLTQGYRPIVEHLYGLEKLALVGLGLGLASSIAASFETLAHQIYLPDFYKGTHLTDPRARARSWENLWKEIVPGYFAIAVFVTGLSPAIVRLLAPSHYGDAWTYLAIGAWIEFFRMTGNVAVLLSFSEMKTTATIRPYVEGAALALAGIAATGWIGLSLLVGQLYATSRLALHFRKNASFAFGTRRGNLAALSALPFLLPLLFREQLEVEWIAILTATLAAMVFGALQLKLWLSRRNESTVRT